MPREFIAGLLSGAVSTVATHPFDTVKVKMQVTHRPYRGMLHCAVDMIRTEGVLSLFRGMLPPLLARPYVQAAGFGIMGQLRRVMDEILFVNGLERSTSSAKPTSTMPSASTTKKTTELSVAHMVGVSVAGGLTGVSLACLMSPIELVKIKLQEQSKQSARPPAAAAAATTSTAAPTLPQSQPARRHIASLSGLMHTHALKSPNARSLSSGPSQITLEPPFEGTWDCAKRLYQHHGVRGLFQGTVATAVRNGLGWASFFVVSDLCKLHLRDVRARMDGFWRYFGGQGKGRAESLPLEAPKPVQPTTATAAATATATTAATATATSAQRQLKPADTLQHTPAATGTASEKLLPELARYFAQLKTQTPPNLTADEREEILYTEMSVTSGGNVGIPLPHLMHSQQTPSASGPDPSAATANPNDVGAVFLLLSGGLAGMVSCMIAMPADLVKSRLQVQSLSAPRYKGIWDCTVQSWREGGWRIFYTGLYPALLRNIIGSATVLLVYEEAVKFLKTV